MQFFSAATVALFSATALAAPTLPTTPTPCPPEESGNTVYQIKDFTTRKYDGQNVATLSFDILATNGGTLDFECSPYDPATNAATDAFESGHVYSCGLNSQFSFSYDVETTELVLWQDVSEGTKTGGSSKTGEPICRAGGSGADDEVCTVPDSFNISLIIL